MVYGTSLKNTGNFHYLRFLLIYRCVVVIVVVATRIENFSCLLVFVRLVDGFIHDMVQTRIIIGWQHSSFFFVFLLPYSSLSRSFFPLSFSNRFSAFLTINLRRHGVRLSCQDKHGSLVASSDAQILVNIRGFKPSIVLDSTPQHGREGKQPSQ